MEFLVAIYIRAEGETPEAAAQNAVDSISALGNGEPLQVYVYDDWFNKPGKSDEPVIESEVSVEDTVINRGEG